MSKSIKNFFLDLLFPTFCLNCQREGNYLCEDCQAILEISGFHRLYSTKNLSDLYFAIGYQKPLIKNLIQNFKYEPFIKELKKTLSSLIINHFQLLDNQPDFVYPVREQSSSNGADFVLIPVPLEKKKLKQRGFNQAEEIGKEISKFLNVEILNNVLIKTKGTLPQVELSDEERKENILGAFEIKNKELVQNRKILLVDDVYTTGSTMEECGRILKESGAKEIIGIVVARAESGKDYPNV